MAVVTLRRRSGPKRDFRTLAKAAAAAADGKKADDVMVLDIRKESDIADYLVIAGANSSTQMNALTEWVEETMLEQGLRVLHRDGKARSRWMALDFGGLVVHILLTEAREFYRLEKLWEKAKNGRESGKTMILDQLRKELDHCWLCPWAKAQGLDALPAYAIEEPPAGIDADLACNLALLLAKPLKKSPRALAEDLKKTLEGSLTLVEGLVDCRSRIFKFPLDA